jgi:hypothetical protein
MLTTNVPETLDQRPQPQRRLAKPAATPQAPAVATSLSIVQAALASGNIEMYREAVNLMKELDAFAARKAFDVALANAQAEIPTIVKNRLVDFVGQKGRTSYRHEDLAEIVETIRPILHKHGLGHRFALDQFERDGKPKIKVTCIISGHGHREETPLESGPDSNPSNMNELQRIQSAITYLERGTLKAALGLAASEDDDSRATSAMTCQDKAPAAPTPGTISTAQVDEIRLLLEERGIAERAFLQFVKLNRIEDIGVQHFDRAVTEIKKREKR